MKKKNEVKGRKKTNLKKYICTCAYAHKFRGRKKTNNLKKEKKQT